jgi:glycosyltransferase involved in cell wall biosynthesis
MIVHAPQLKEALLARLPGPEDRVHVIPHVLCGDDTAAPDVSEDDHTILFFGRIWPYKGLEYLIRAEPLITARVPDARIVIAGNGEPIDRYRSMMVHADRFAVHNEYVSDEERARLFRKASVVVLPYVEASQSGVIPVAYRYSKPVVATTVGGLPALVDQEQTGLLVPPRDHTRLAEAIIRLLEDPDLRHRLGASGKHKIETECSPDAVARQTMLVYQKATGSTQRVLRHFAG